jgi:hypothetical protein
MNNSAGCSCSEQRALRDPSTRRVSRQSLLLNGRSPTLSTYLGHVHVSDTYWYLSALPELMGHALDRLEKHWEGAR